MRINLNDILFALSGALDCVEQELLGVTTNHGKRVAYLSVLMGRQMGLAGQELAELAGCAVLHDNALTEFIREEYNEGRKNTETVRQKLPARKGRHCVMGERNAAYIPFRTDVKGAVLYHHENADGTGPFLKKAEETPIKAQIIHMADVLDAAWDFASLTEEKFKKVSDEVKRDQGTLFSEECAELFFRAVDFSKMAELETLPDSLLMELVPGQELDYTGEEIRRIAALFARIIDYKSPFTGSHSMGIADKAEIMGRYYGYSEEKLTKIYLAGALHDLGKLTVDKDVLEKPGKLTDAEYAHVQNHAYGTYEMLSKIKGLEDVTEWASLHHEKLNGAGYPFGKKEEELSQEDRLMACVDIYQALTEKRPYKDGFSHEKAIGIMQEMADRFFIDKRIVGDLNIVFRQPFN